MMIRDRSGINLYSLMPLLLFVIIVLYAPHAFAQTNTCVTTNCHATMGKDKFVHPPLMDGCITCHIATQEPADKKTTHPGNLKITLAKQEVNELCFSCHQDKQKSMMSKKTVHPPVKQSCLLCHNPHGSANKAVLSAEVPALCANCHPNEASLTQKALYKHGPMIDTRTCMNCHDPHSSDFSKLLSSPQAELCLSCHNKELNTESGKIKDLKAFLDANKGGQGPLKGKPCATCHNPHGSDYWHLKMP